MFVVHSFHLEREHAVSCFPLLKPYFVPVALGLIFFCRCLLAIGTGLRFLSGKEAEARPDGELPRVGQVEVPRLPGHAGARVRPLHRHDRRCGLNTRARKSTCYVQPRCCCTVDKNRFVLSEEDLRRGCSCLVGACFPQSFDDRQEAHPFSNGTPPFLLLWTTRTQSHSGDLLGAVPSSSSPAHPSFIWGAIPSAEPPLSDRRPM